jgi:hypothetical protein
MNDSCQSALCILTPSYRGDIEPFALLRESIRRFAPGFPHVVVVHTEDYRMFRHRFRDDTQLEIVRTAEVLPRSVERRRQKAGSRWLTGTWLWGPRINERRAQQLARIYALAQCQYEAAVFLDSDVSICEALDPKYFYVDDRLKLFRQRAVNAEAQDLDISTHDIVGNPLHDVGELYDYISHPACFRKSTAVRLLEELVRRRRSESRWIRKLLEERRPSEYNLLGYAATVLEECAHYALVECGAGELQTLAHIHAVRIAQQVACE